MQTHLVSKHKADQPVPRLEHLASFGINEGANKRHLRNINRMTVGFMTQKLTQEICSKMDTTNTVALIDHSSFLRPKHFGKLYGLNRFLLKNY